MAYPIDGIGNKFRFQRNMSDANMLALARAFHSESAPYEADFIAYEMYPNFRTDLTSCSLLLEEGGRRFADGGGGRAFEASFSDTASATAEHVAATADTSSKIRQGMVIVRVLDGIVKNKYANDPGKLAAWISASHLEKAPKKKAPPTP